MKSFRSTFLALVFVGGLVGYSIYEYRKGEVTENKAIGEEKLFSFLKEDVDHVVIKRKDETIEIKRDGDYWQVLQPVQDLAELSAVDGFLHMTLAQKARPLQSSDEAKITNWAEFGLEPAGRVIEISAKGKTEVLQVSSKNAFDGSYYLRMKDQIYLADRGLAQTADRSASTFRSRRLWREEDMSVDSAQVELNYENLKGKFTFKKNGDVWTIEPKPKFVVDSERIVNWIRRVQDLVPIEIVADQIKDGEKRGMLLLKPSLTVSLPNKKGGLWTIVIGQDKAEDVYLYTNVRDTIYRIQTPALRQVRVDAAFFRDGHTPFLFPLEQAQEVELMKPGFSQKLKRDHEAWSAGEGVKVDQDKLIGLFQTIRQLDVQEYVDPKAVSGFLPEQNIIVRDAAGKVLLSLAWGGEYKSKLPYGRGLGLTYLRSNLSSDVIAISKEAMSGLIDPSIVTKPAPAKPKGKTK